MRYQHLRIMLYHPEAMMAAVILSFLSVHVCRRGFFFFLKGKKTDCFFFLYMHRKIYSPEIWEPCLAYILGCVCNDPENVTTYNVFFLISVSSQEISLQGNKNHVLFQGRWPTVNIANNLGWVCKPSRSGSLSYMLL